MVDPSNVVPTDVVWWELFLLFTAVGVLLAGGVTILFLYILVKYRSSSHSQSEDSIKPGFIYVETPVKGVSKVILAITGLIVFGLIVSTIDETLYLEYTPPSDEALVIWVTGVQFAWKFKYAIDNTTVDAPINYLVLPTDTLVEFKVVSEDVFHTFGIPETKVKIDAIPGIVNTMWIVTPKEPTVYKGYCYELCGAGHSLMVADIIIVDKERFYDAYDKGPEEFLEFINSVIEEYGG